jgi:hypothetical protein
VTFRNSVCLPTASSSSFARCGVPIRIDRSDWDVRVASADDGSELAEGFIRSAPEGPPLSVALAQADGVRGSGRLGGMQSDPLGLTSRPPVIGRVATATITLVCVLVVYDGWAALRLFDVVVIVVAPIVAIFTSHVFSSSLVQLVELGRRPTVGEWLVTLRFESRFLLLAVPPLVVLLVLDRVGVALSDSIRGVILLEALLLGFWAGLAAWYAGLRGRPLAGAVLAGLVVSCIVLVLQVILQPGKPVKGGAAARNAVVTKHA